LFGEKRFTDKSMILFPVGCKGKEKSLEMPGKFLNFFLA
jgi:hypothetical protein